jgi:predicted Zn-dependent protease
VGAFLFEETQLEVDQYQKIKAAIESGEYTSALALLDDEPAQESETLYLRAVCQRRIGQSAEALLLLDELIALFPKHARAFQERGHILRSAGQDNAALAAYGRATQENPSLGASWRAQAEILLAQGRISEANRLKPYMQRLAKMPAELIFVQDILSQGSIGRAEETCRKFLQENPRHVEGMRLLAEVAIKLNVLDEAEFLLESAVLFEPENHALVCDYIGILRKRQKLKEARDQAEKLFDAEPNNIQFKSQFAVTSMQLGDYDCALRLFDEVLSEMPGEPITLTSKGHALKTIGQTTEAIGCYQEACRDGVIHGEAWQSLANLKTYRFNDQEIKRMRALLEKPALRSMDRVYLAFALGKAYEDLKDYDTAFSMYSEGNHIKRTESRYISAHMTEEFREQKHIFSNLQRSDGGCSDADPIFIVGMPRAGSTLLEQILSSHSQVDGTQELPNVLAIVQQLRTKGESFDRLNYPREIRNLTPDDLNQLGQLYIDGTRAYRAEAPFFIDKMPNNFRHIGLIKLMLPNAKIIDARRHPLSCSFSCFKQLFAEGQEFSYSLEDLGHYYRDYVELMDFWHSCFDGQILHVQYEDVVADLESEVRKILEYCELPFEDQCLKYWDTERAVKTPSSEQVRQPIFQSGVENWQMFEAHLEPLKVALGSALTNYRPKTHSA